MIVDLYSITIYNPHFKVDRCTVCGFIFMNPPLRRDVLHAFYSKEYYTGISEYAYHDERDTKKYPSVVRDKRIEKIHLFIQGGRFLDIGAAFGTLLDSAKRYFIPYGIEVSLYAGQHAKSIYGDTIHIGTLDDHPFPREYFSVITMIEVIEHIENPLQALTECHNLLEKGGLLVVQTANMAGLQAVLQKGTYAYFMPGHCSYFTRKNLTKVLRQIGFSRIKVFHPVDFGLVPKLCKSRGTFSSLWDYRKWIRITLYHWISKIRCGDFAMTSSMVIYAFK